MKVALNMIYKNSGVNRVIIKYGVLKHFKRNGVMMA